MATFKINSETIKIEEDDLDGNMQEQLSRQKGLKYYFSQDNFPRQYLQEAQADASLIH